MDRRRLTAGALALAMTTLGVASGAQAATIRVDTKTDEFTNASAKCSLREAVQSANLGVDYGGCEASGSYAATEKILLRKGRYNLTRAGEENQNVFGDLDPKSPVRIVGSRRGTTIDANQLDRVLTTDVAPATLERLGITGGSTPVNGGGIFAGADLTVIASTIYGNVAGDTGGSFAGGGIGGALANVTIRSSTISGNSAPNAGGGVNLNVNPGPTHLLRIFNSTITKNVANTGDLNRGGGGIAVARSALRMRGSIVAGNRALFGEAPDCEGFDPTPSLGRNLIGDTSGCNYVAAPSDVINRNARLRKLADNGGPTRTHALRRSSPAIDKGGKKCPKRDQRGVRRSLGGKRCDIGAFERVKR